MPGQTNNTDFLASFNQIIKALNDLQLLIETGDPPQNLAVLVEQIGDNIEVLRTTLEARSVADTVALNTNFDGLIQQLKRCCSSGCGGSGGGYAPPSQAGTEGDDPPTNLSGEIIWNTVTGAPSEGLPGQPTYHSRKCKVANGLVEDLTGVIQVADDNAITQFGFDAAFAIMGYALGELATPIPFIDGALGAIIGLLADLILAFLDQGVDISQLRTTLTANQEDLVCALYSSGSYGDAISSVNDVLSNAGEGIGNIGVVDAILVIDIVNYLYFKSSEYLEAKLANYTPPIDCSGCGDCEEIYFGYGTRNGDTFESEALSGPFSGEHRVSFVVNYDGSDACGDTLSLIFSNWSGFTGVTYNERLGFAISDDLNHTTNDGDSYEVVNTNTPPASQQYANCRLIIIVSSTSFSVDITGFSS